MDAAAKTKADAMAGGMESGGREGVVGTQNNPIMVSPQRLHSIPQGRTASTTAGNTLWALSDHLGSVRDVVDNKEVIRQHVVYDSFGRRLREVDYNSAGAVIASTDPAAVDELFGYTGRDWDVDTQLQNNRARWYDPATGRWLSQDPIGFAAGDANLYRYVGNRPTNATDPSGLDTIWIEGVEYYLPDGWDKEKYVNLLRTDPYIAELARVKNQPEYRGPVIQAATGPELTAEEKDLEYRFQLLEMGWLNNAGKTKLYNDSRRYLHNKLSEQAGLCWFSKWSTDIQFGVTNEGQAIATLIQPRPGLRWKTVPIGTSGVKYPFRGPAPKGPIQVSEQSIRQALEGSGMSTTQGGVSIPKVERFLRRLEAGEVPPPIKVDNGVIVEGHHRYIAGRLFGKEPAIDPGTMSRSQASKVKPIQDIKCSPEDWGD